MLVLYGSLESSSQFFEFRRCHFFEHDGMLRELFYCLWRGSNMSVVCTEDEIIFIYLECVLRKMAKKFRAMWQKIYNLISWYQNIIQILQTYKQNHEKINILNCYFIAWNVLLGILSFYSKEKCVKCKLRGRLGIRKPFNRYKERTFEY